MLLAEVKWDNRHIGIYEIDSGAELFEFDFSQLDEDWSLEISQLCGDCDSGWIIFQMVKKHTNIITLEMKELSWENLCLAQVFRQMENIVHIIREVLCYMTNGKICI